MDGSHPEDTEEDTLECQREPGLPQGGQVQHAGSKPQARSRSIVSGQQSGTRLEFANRGEPQGDAANADDEEGQKFRMWAGQSNILVAVRLRPLLKHDRTQVEIATVLDHKVVVLADPSKVNDDHDILRVNRSREKRYAFDYVFDKTDGQYAVYKNTTKFLIQGVLDGFNATVFAYGCTGAGKTFTMIGTPQQPGIMVLTLQDLFKEQKKVGEEQDSLYSVKVSFLEVYNENLRDLLSDVDEYLDLREDPIKGPTVAGISEVEVGSPEEIMELLHKGNVNRTQQATAANAVSSRSHAVLQVVVENRERHPGTVAKMKMGKLSLVDLAGSERAAATQNRGVRLVEGANINRSLLALGNCINALGEKGNKGQFVPYRDSKLTRLLKDSLGGNCRTVMIANISMAISSFEETLNTLKYANRAKNIKTNVQRNVLNVNYHIGEYVSLIANLRTEITRLKHQLAEQDLQPPPPSLPRQSSRVLPESFPLPGTGGTRRAPEEGGGEEDLGEGLTLDREFVEEVRQKIVDNFRERMQLRRSLIELEDQNVQNSIEVSKRQLQVAEWNDTRGKTPASLMQHKRRGGSGSPPEDQDPGGEEDLAESALPSVEAIMNEAPPDVQQAWTECEQLRSAVSKNGDIKRKIARRLRNNERQAERFREELTTKVTGEDRKQLLELQYRLGKLELDNMELEQARIVHDSVMKGKDLTIQKLQLQLAVRDKVIAQQQRVLSEHNLGSLVGYNSLRLMEQAALADNFDTLIRGPAGRTALAPETPEDSARSMTAGDSATERPRKRSAHHQRRVRHRSSTTNHNGGAAEGSSPNQDASEGHARPSYQEMQPPPPMAFERSEAGRGRAFQQRAGARSRDPHPVADGAHTRSPGQEEDAPWPPRPRAPESVPGVGAPPGVVRGPGQRSSTRQWEPGGGPGGADIHARPLPHHGGPAKAFVEDDDLSVASSNQNYGGDWPSPHAPTHPHAPPPKLAHRASAGDADRDSHGPFQDALRRHATGGLSNRQRVRKGHTIRMAGGDPPPAGGSGHVGEEGLPYLNTSKIYPAANGPGSLPPGQAAREDREAPRDRVSQFPLESSGDSIPGLGVSTGPAPGLAGPPSSVRPMIQTNLAMLKAKIHTRQSSFGSGLAERDSSRYRGQGGVAGTGIKDDFTLAGSAVGGAPGPQGMHYSRIRDGM